MEAILGPLPPRFCRETRKTKYFWHSQLDWDPDSADGKYVRDHCRKLKVGGVYRKRVEFGRVRSTCWNITSCDLRLLPRVIFLYWDSEVKYDTPQVSEDVGNSHPVGGQVYSLYGMILAKVKRRFLIRLNFAILQVCVCGMGWREELGRFPFD